MTDYFPLRQKPSLAPYKKGDFLILFGELFTRGYANGLVEEAEKLGMTIIQTTVGRRDPDGSLRKLNEDEFAHIQTPFINIPLESGFDLEKNSAGISPVDQLKETKLSNWQNCKLDFASIQESQKKGTLRFRNNVKSYISEVEKLIPPGANVLFAHLMAGGVPRAKIVMPIMNWVFKGSGDRNVESEVFWSSDIGRLCELSFNEVTADSFRHLLELSTDMRNKIESNSGHVSYIAYGYHGTEVEINGNYQWQTYSPYIQGWAKKRLENIAAEYHSQGINCCVYNCPEILTNSSSIFQGVEIPLYALLSSLSKNTNHAKSKEVASKCLELLKDDLKIDTIVETLNSFFNNPLTKKYCSFENWPMHSSKEQMELMLNTSDEIRAFHKNEKIVMTSLLSEVVFECCGYIMLHDSWKPTQSKAWINHDVIIKTF